MPTVRQCLVDYPIFYDTYTESVSVSAKPNSAQLSRPTLEIHLDGNSVLGPESDPDTARYNRIIAQPLPSVQSEVKNEGDVRRVYAQLINIVEQAFFDGPKVWHRWEAGPPGPGVNTTETIDTWWGVYINGHQRCAAIGELKRPGVINIAEWRRADANVPTIRLGKEIRMYAHQYNCPQAFYFDGNYLLVLRFKATSRNHIRQPDCNASCFWLYKDSPAVPYWIDRLVAEGLNRLRSQVAPALSLDGYDRMFRFYDGLPYWVQGQNVLWDHPGGYRRRFTNGQWWWYLNGQPHTLDTPSL